LQGAKCERQIDKLERVTTATHLSTKELAGLVIASRKRRALFKPLLDERKFFHHVVRCEHDAVKAMLGQNIDLLVKKSIVTDCSGGTFEPISPFEYALWALDKHMWDAMLQCIPQNDKGNEVLAQLRSQYKALRITENILKEKKPQIRGLTYRLNGTIITEPHFDFQNTIIKELKTQIDSMNTPWDHRDWDAIDKQWREGVGGAQRLFPVHVINEFCAFIYFDKAEFNSYPGSSKKFYNWITKRDENWFNEGSKLGIDFGLYKGRLGVAGLPLLPVGGRNSEFVGRPRLDRDLVGMTKLFKIRTNDFTNLESQLEERLIIANNQPMTLHM
jgi:hypothetical protein